MGSLNLPSSWIVYVDTAPVIYSVEKHPDYSALLDPLWAASELGQIRIIGSELILLEILTGAFKRNDPQLVADYEKVLTAAEIKLIPISPALLRQAARLRATINLKTPDAIHAATALANGCVQLITNDKDLKRVTMLDVAVLSEIV
ncbi:MAG: PIN domain-containing protein [Acidobacteriota bacterium]